MLVAEVDNSGWVYDTNGARVSTVYYETAVEPKVDVGVSLMFAEVVGLIKVTSGRFGLFYYCL